MLVSTDLIEAFSAISKRDPFALKSLDADSQKTVKVAAVFFVLLGVSALSTTDLKKLKMANLIDSCQIESRHLVLLNGSLLAVSPFTALAII